MNTEIANVAKTDWAKLVGRRLLIREVQRMSGDTTTEVRLKELAPSEKYMRVLWMSGTQTWIAVEKYELVEELPGELPAAVTEPAGGLELIARSIWWRYTTGRVIERVDSDGDTTERIVDSVMLRWEADPRGLMIGFDVNDRVLSEIVNGSGAHHRAEFEQSVRAWLAVHRPAPVPA